MARGAKFAGEAGALAGRDPRKQAFARRLWELMMEKGWNQSILARRAELGRDLVSGYIRGRNLPDPKNANKLAQALGIPLEELFPERMTPPADHNTPIAMKATQPGMAFININVEVPFDVAAKVIALVGEVLPAKGPVKSE